MKSGSRSNALLMELLIVILFFMNFIEFSIQFPLFDETDQMNMPDTAPFIILIFIDQRHIVQFHDGGFGIGIMIDPVEIEHQQASGNKTTVHRRGKTLKIAFPGEIVDAVLKRNDEIKGMLKIEIEHISFYESSVKSGVGGFSRRDLQHGRG